MPGSNPSASATTNNAADAGFRLPGADSAPATGATPAVGSTPVGIAPGSVSTPANPPGNTAIDGVPQTDTSNRDLTLAGGIFLVLLLAFFFARGAYVNHLVSRRVSPGSAGNAGWLLFIGLAFLSAAIVLGLINAEKYLSLWVTGPLVLVGLGSLLGAVLTGRR
jgi:LPXTG-motif cell wall-anchored protein